jgi:hypothetical protein
MAPHWLLACAATLSEALAVVNRGLRRKRDLC